MASSPRDTELVGAPSHRGRTTDALARVCVEMTVKEYATREQVTERTVWVWLAKGAVKFRKTPGGGIRVVVPDDPLKITEVQ